MLTFDYGSPYFWDKVVLTKFISGCRMVWDLICGTSWSYKSRTEKVTAGRKSAILPNWCCLLFITVLSGYPCFMIFQIYFQSISLTKRKLWYICINSMYCTSLIKSLGWHSIWQQWLHFVLQECAQLCSFLFFSCTIWSPKS